MTTDRATLVAHFQSLQEEIATRRAAGRSTDDLLVLRRDVVEALRPHHAVSDSPLQFSEWLAALESEASA